MFLDPGKMAPANLVFRDGGNNNKLPWFGGEHYIFWKIHMQAYLEAQDDDICYAVENGPYVPKTVINNVE